jgi:hypothetical protein
MDYGKLIARVQSYVPPRLWREAHHLYAWSALLRGARAELLRNRSLRNRFHGQRAFVIGNGSSLNLLDLSRLQGELTFTVNSFFEHAPRLGVTPTCHAFIDPSFFGELTEVLRHFAATRGPETLCFVPWRYREVAHRFVPDAYCLLAAGMPDANRNLDLERPIPELRTVTLAALLVALHLGCDPIYLIGCDMNLLSKVVDVRPLRVAADHFYDQGSDVIAVEGMDYAAYCHAVYQMLDGFRFIRDQVGSRRRIYNAGVGSLLDVFPSVDYASLF